MGFAPAPIFKVTKRKKRKYGQEVFEKFKIFALGLDIFSNFTDVLKFIVRGKY